MEPGGKVDLKGDGVKELKSSSSIAFVLSGNRKANLVLKYGTYVPVFETFN